jgi:hypothetical protein
MFIKKPFLNGFLVHFIIEIHERAGRRWLYKVAGVVEIGDNPLYPELEGQKDSTDGKWAVCKK